MGCSLCSSKPEQSSNYDFEVSAKNPLANFKVKYHKENIEDTSLSRPHSPVPFPKYGHLIIF